MKDRIKWGILGNATIARKCVIGAIQKSRNGLVHALATQSPADLAKVATKKIKPPFFSYLKLSI
jgi:predicted dehydrogenase